MIVIYHQYNKVVEVLFNEESMSFSKKNIPENLFNIAKKYPDQLIIWCQLDLKLNLNHEILPKIFHHNKIMASFNVSGSSFLPDTIGYVDESPFLNVKKDVSYPTWKMSSDVGGIHSSVLKALYRGIKIDSNFDYFLNSLAKLTIEKGLLCYSEPSLIKNNLVNIKNRHQSNNLRAFRFVKQHYKTRWTLLLFLNLFLYERKLVFLPLLSSLFFKRRILKESVLDQIHIVSSKKIEEEKTIDVIIPTIGRKAFLYDFLKDLSKQSHLPENVIIIEQNPDLNSESELDYLTLESWPFRIKHTFTHQTGACNARNLALTGVESKWIFMADDDIRIDNDFIEKGFNVVDTVICGQITFGCFQPNYSQSKKLNKIHQWETFGSGCSIVRTKNIKSLFFNKSFEFGFGEDSDYGMQLRKLGFDILYSPKPEIIHLKAPIGGFRTKPVLLWDKEDVQPKPSPTVMLYKILYLIPEQIKGYKTVLFFKFYPVQKIKNPVKYFYNFKKQWKSSVFWADKLKN